MRCFDVASAPRLDFSKTQQMPAYASALQFALADPQHFQLLPGLRHFQRHLISLRLAQQGLA